MPENLAGELGMVWLWDPQRWNCYIIIITNFKQIHNNIWVLFEGLACNRFVCILQVHSWQWFATEIGGVNAWTQYLSCLTKFNSSTRFWNLTGFLLGLSHVKKLKLAKARLDSSKWLPKQVEGCNQGLPENIEEQIMDICKGPNLSKYNSVDASLGKQCLEGSKRFEYVGGFEHHSEQVSKCWFMLRHVLVQTMANSLLWWWASRQHQCICSRHHKGQQCWPLAQTPDA